MKQRSSRDSTHHTGIRLFPHMCNHRTGKHSSPRADRIDPCPSAHKSRHRNHSQPPSSRNDIHHVRYNHYRTARGNYPHHKFTATVNAANGHITPTARNAHALRSRANRPQRVLLVPWVSRHHCAQRPHLRQHVTSPSEICNFSIRRWAVAQRTNRNEIQWKTLK